ncbi:acetyltransferase [bacterium]|nr:acetyltransferase [bacterium]
MKPMNKKKYEKPVLLIGAGSQGRVVLDVLLARGRAVTGFLDDDPSLPGHPVRGLPVLGTVGTAAEYGGTHEIVLSIGNNETRCRLMERLNLPEANYANAVHPSAVIFSSATIGHGNMIFAQTFVGSDARIGNHVILNNGCIVEHDCEIHDFAALGPGCSMGGRVHIHEGAFISTGVTIAPRIRIGKNSVVGAGAVVVQDLPDYVLAYGVPARIVRKIGAGELWDRLL